MRTGGRQLAVEKNACLLHKASGMTEDERKSSAISPGLLLESASSAEAGYTFRVDRAIQSASGYRSLREGLPADANRNF